MPSPLLTQADLAKKGPYAGVPSVIKDIDSIFLAVSALKEVVEVLVRARGQVGDSAVRVSELERILSGIRFDIDHGSPDRVATDPDAIHDNIADEISTIDEKSSPVIADIAVIEDSEAGNLKKKVQLGNFPGVGGSAWNEHGNTATGTASEPLKIDAGALWIDGDVGDLPSGASGAGTRFLWVPSGPALRAGVAVGAEWDSVVGNTYGIGQNLTLSNGNPTIRATICMGIENSANVGDTVFGRELTGGNQDNVLLGNVVDASNAIQCVYIGNVINQSAVPIYGTGNIFIGNNLDCAAFASRVALVGNYISATNTSSGALGQYIELQAASAFVFGMGYKLPSTPYTVYPLVNDIQSSMMFGVGSNLPTMTLRNDSPGENTTGQIGIATTTPKSTFEVAGSVGYKYRIHSHSADGPTLIIGANEDELVFLIEPNTGDVTITLPPILGIGRRMYYITNTAIGASATGHTVHIDPGSDNIQQPGKSTAPSTLDFDVDRNESAQVLAVSETSTWRIL